MHNIITLALIVGGGYLLYTGFFKVGIPSASNSGDGQTTTTPSDPGHISVGGVTPQTPVSLPLATHPTGYQGGGQYGGINPTPVTRLPTRKGIEPSPVEVDPSNSPANPANITTAIGME